MYKKWWFLDLIYLIVFFLAWNTLVCHSKHSFQSVKHIFQSVKHSFQSLKCFETVLLCAIQIFLQNAIIVKSVEMASKTNKCELSQRLWTVSCISFQICTTYHSTFSIHQRIIIFILLGKWDWPSSSCESVVKWLYEFLATSITVTLVTVPIFSNKWSYIKNGDQTLGLVKWIFFGLHVSGSASHENLQYFQYFDEVNTPLFHKKRWNC